MARCALATSGGNFSDTRKARERLGWSAHVSLEQGLDQTVAWFLEHNHLIGSAG